jgi:hypothetical protein
LIFFSCAEHVSIKQHHRIHDIEIEEVSSGEEEITLTSKNSLSAMLPYS